MTENNTTAERIYNELLQLAEYYQIRDTQFENTLAKTDLSHYVEIVLLQDGFELVVGGTDREQELLEWARAMHFPAKIIEAFQQCTQLLPHKMLYSKICFGKKNTPPSLYLCPIEPWDKLLPFLQSLTEIAEGANELRDITNKREICFLCGFTTDQQDNLVVKVYHLSDRQFNLPKPQHFLTSLRLSNGKLHDEVKTYTTNISWDYQLEKTDWTKVVTFARSLFGDRYQQMLGELTDPSGRQAFKIYLFRFDKRENEYYSLKTYNYYAAEGNSLLEEKLPRQAIRSFTEAIDFNTGSDLFLANIYNVRGVLYYEQQEYQLAVNDFSKALEFNPNLGNDNLIAASQMIHPQPDLQVEP